MSARTASSLALVLIACASGASAAPATPEEAQRLTTLFERFVGHAQPSAVAVTPDGEAYAASLDIGRLFGFLQGTGLTVTSAGSLAARLTPQPDGHWRVVIDGLPEVGAAFDKQASSITVNGYAFDGSFDPAIQAFVSSDTRSAGSVSRSVGPRTSSTATVTGTSAGHRSATASGAGTINVTLEGTTKDFSYDAEISTPGPTADAPNRSVTFTVRGASLTTHAVLADERNVALNELWAFLVAHPSKAELIAHQPELKTRLKALLPFATSTSSDLAATALSVSTSVGTFAAARASEHIDSPDENGGWRSTLKLSELTLPPQLIPAWAAPLTPTALDVTESTASLNLTPALLALIDQFDLADEKPLTDQQIAAFRDSVGAGGTSLRIAPSTISTALMTLHFESDLKLTPSMVPGGTATIAVTGLDRTIDAIRTAAPGDPMAAQAIGVMGLIKSQAKAEGPDSYSWRIEAVPGGAITVNGNPLGGVPGRPKPRKHPLNEP